MNLLRAGVAAALAAALPCATAALAADARAAFTVATDDGVFRLRLAWPASAEDMPIVQMHPAGGRLVLRVPASTLGHDAFVPDPGAQSAVRSLTVQVAGDEGFIIIALRQPSRYEMTKSTGAWVLELRPAAQIASAPPPASPAPLPAAVTATVSETLLLDTVVNGRRLSDVVQADRLADGRLALPRQAWEEARLKPHGETVPLSDGSPGYALDAVSGLGYTVDRRRQTLTVTAPADAFAMAAVDARAAVAAPPPRPEPGVLVNYDFTVGLHQGSRIGLGGTVEGIFFNRWGSFATSALVSNADDPRRVRRLDSSWQYDMPERMESVIVGDTIGTPGAWSRPVRYAGVRWGRDFGLSPSFVTLPQPGITGSAALPSTVEVLIGNQQRMTSRVPAGPFELTGVPVIAGAGEMSLVVRDLLGRENIVTQGYYASPRLLASGLDDYAFEAGRLRTGYGSASDAYGDGFAAATWRRGWTGSLTGEMRVELQRERRAAGVEIAGLLGTWAVARASYARSGGSAGSGAHWILGIERSAGNGNAALQWERSDAGFVPFAYTPRETRPRDRLAANFGTHVGRVGVGMSYVRQTSWNAPPIALVAASLSAALPGRFSLSASYSRELDGHGGWRAGITLSRVLDDGLFATSSIAQNGSGPASLDTQVSSTSPSALGASWRVGASNNESRVATGAVNWNTPYADASAEVESGRRGDAAVRAGVRGSAGWLAGLGFASRPVGHGSFAVVKAGDSADVPVLRSHGVVTRTNGEGLAFVAGLLPYQPNVLEVDPSGISLDTEFASTRIEVVPHARSGTVVDFGLRRSRGALVELVTADGRAVPAGARVQLAGGESFTVAARGEVYLTGLQQENRLEAKWPAGECAAAFALPAMGEVLPRIGPLRCEVGAMP